MIKVKMPKENILIFCAHSDDQILGAGGTIAKYAKEGKNIFTYIFSYGESSHPWLKRKITVEIRVKESKKADSVVGGKGIVFFGLHEGKFLSHEKDLKDKIKKIIKERKPTKIFIHSYDDPHPDHLAVCKSVSEATNELKYNGDVYSFDVWNPFNIRKRYLPKLIVDITATFNLKIKAINCFKSQKLSMLFLVPAIYARAFFNGLYRGCKYAEIFYKIR